MAGEPCSEAILPSASLTNFGGSARTSPTGEPGPLGPPGPPPFIIDWPPYRLREPSREQTPIKPPFRTGRKRAVLMGASYHDSPCRGDRALAARARKARHRLLLLPPGQETSQRGRRAVLDGKRPINWWHDVCTRGQAPCTLT